MKKETLFIAFSTQKGGTGKTTLTVLTASYLHYVLGYDVAVVDCDYPQHSIAEMRERDVARVTGDEHYKRPAHVQFSTLRRKAYPVEESKATDAVRTAESLMADGDFDFIFFDLPGTLNSEGVVKTLAAMDYVFAPVSADRIVPESTLRFATMLNDSLVTTGKSNIRELYMVWNMVDGREKTDLYHAYDGAIAELGLKVMRTVVPDSKRFRREMCGEHRPVFRSTIFPADKRLLKGGNVGELANEICEIVKPRT